MDNFELLDMIGAGSFGEIHKVKRKSDGRIMARKSISYGKMNEKEKRQLVVEVNILRELKHPNIVRYYERFVDKERSIIYIFMEYCQGGDLASLIRQARKEKRYIDEDVIWRIFTQVLCGLHECHTYQNGYILHRDLKPENIFLDAGFNAKIGDFGLSRVLDDHRNDPAKSFVGTPYYMSPEQMNDAVYDVKSDIWSLGCILYELCALVPPFEAVSQSALSAKINQGKINRLPSHYSDDLNRIIRAMLQIDSPKRPATKDFFYVPQVKLYMREWKISQQLSAMRTKEEKLAERERELRAKEVELNLREASLLGIARAYQTGPLNDTAKPLLECTLNRLLLKELPINHEKKAMDAISTENIH